MSDAVDAPFFDPYDQGFVRLAAAVPALRVADPAYNAARTIERIEQAVAEKVALVAFPELGLTGYTCDDLFHQHALRLAALDALTAVRDATAAIDPIVIVGAPLQIDQLLYNCAVVLHRGRVLAVVPKTYLPTYREFYEARYFAPGHASTRPTIDLLGQRNIPFGGHLLLDIESDRIESGRFRLFIEICEDLWVPIPPSSFAALAGATVTVNLSASNVTVGKADYRHNLVRNQSGRCVCAYVYTAAGVGESSTDMSFDGHALIYENGRRLCESRRFDPDPQLIVADVDLDRLCDLRLREGMFDESRRLHREAVDRFRILPTPIDLPRAPGEPLRREVARYPYVPNDKALRDARCEETYNIQIQALTKRLTAARIDRAVIGVSGGLDSTHALLVLAQAFDRLGLDRKQIHAVTMPGFATSQRTRNNSHQLMAALGVDVREIDIRPACTQMLRDIGHPAADGEPIYDVTFENVQAGERTSRLFRLANHLGGMVIGTGDLSELALGWTTYGVGDHMSHYAINVSIPKTFIRYLVTWAADHNGELSADAIRALRDVIDTEISPELVPSDTGNGSGEGPPTEPAQSTEAAIGPFELHDFALYYITRTGTRPRKIAYLAWQAWRDESLGRWPGIPEVKRRAYTLAEIKKWLRMFCWRFFQTSQFKRSCIPNGPKIGHGGSLSPRGDWRAPSDAEATAWLADVDRIPDDDAPSSSG